MKNFEFDRGRSVDPILVVAFGALLLRIVSRVAVGARVGLSFDEGAYLSAASWIGRGAVPYRDAAAAHPPGMFLLYAPLTWFGSPTTSIVAMRFASIVIGSVSTWVVGDLVRRHRSLSAGVAAAITYAVLPEALAVERSILVEPVLNLLMLVAARAWLLAPEGDAKDRRSVRASGSVVAGLAWGLAMFCKLPAMLLAVPIAATSLVRRRPVGAVAAVLVAAATLVVTLSPVLLLAARPFYEQVVLFQIGRPSEGIAAPDRYAWIWGVGGERSALRALPATSIALAGLTVFVVDCRRRVADELLVFGLAWYSTCAVSMAVSSVYLTQYNALFAPGLALIAGSVASRFRTRPSRAPSAVIRFLGGSILAVGLVVSLLLITDVPGRSAEAAGQEASVAQAVRRHRDCLWSWHPHYLVSGDRLPDIDRFGPIATDPAAAEVGAALARNEPGAEMGGYRTLSRSAMAQCPYALATDDGMSDLPTTHHVVVNTYPGGPQIWQRRTLGG